MYSQILIQSLAVLGLTIWATSYHFQSRKKILLVQLVSFIFWISHFILLGAIVGAIVSSIAAIRLFVFAFKKKDNWISHPSVPVFFVIVSVFATYITATTYLAVFALIGGVFAIIASAQNEENKIRKLFIPSHISWIIYDLSVGSYGGALSEAILGMSALISLFKKK